MIIITVINNDNNGNNLIFSIPLDKTYLNQCFFLLNPLICFILRGQHLKNLLVPC